MIFMWFTSYYTRFRLLNGASRVIIYLMHIRKINRRTITREYLTYIDDAMIKYEKHKNMMIISYLSSLRKMYSKVRLRFG